MDLTEALANSERRAIEAICAKYWADMIDPEMAEHEIVDMLRSANPEVDKDEVYEAALSIIDSAKPAAA